MSNNALRNFYIEELRDLYNAESQIRMSLPDMARSAYSAELRASLEKHLKQSSHHVEQLDQILQRLGANPLFNPSDTLQKIIAETEAMLRGVETAEISDRVLAEAARRIDYFAMLSYSRVRTYAALLGDEDASEYFSDVLQRSKGSSTG